MRNEIQYKVFGRMALFSDPLTKVGGEKSSYPIPTYQAIKGITESIYWKPTFLWIIDAVRVMNPIRMQARGIRPIGYGGGNDLSIYKYLADVHYEVKAHFEFNMNRKELEEDRNENKHHNIAKRMVDRGGRRDIFLGTRECQAYVEPVEFGTAKGYYDDIESIPFGTMLHGIDYTDESGKKEIGVRLWQPIMEKGVISFPRPEVCKARIIREVTAKHFDKSNVRFVEEEENLI